MRRSRWLDACQDFRLVKPMLTPRFTPSCTDELMAFLGKLAAERDLPVQSHLSENQAEMAWVRQLHPGCQQYWETYAKYGLWNQPHRHGPLRLVRRAGAAGHAGRRRHSGPLRRLQPEHLLRRGAGAGHAG